MPIHTTYTDDMNITRQQAWKLPDELDEGDRQAAFSPLGGIVEGHTHTVYMQLPHGATDALRDTVYDMISDYFVRREGKLDGAYFVNACANGYIGVFFSALMDQYIFSTEMNANLKNHGIRFKHVPRSHARNREVARNRMAAGIMPKSESLRRGYNLLAQPGKIIPLSVVIANRRKKREAAARQGQAAQATGGVIAAAAVFSPAP